MRPLVIYFNEMSCGLRGLRVQAIHGHVDATIAALQETGRLRSDTNLRLPKPLREITLGDDSVTFSQLFEGRNNIFSVLARWIDRTPYGQVAAREKEVAYDGQVGVGMSWAHFEGTFVLSVGHPPPWSDATVPAEERSLNAEGDVVSADVAIKNLATAAHVAEWRQAIADYGLDMANSCRIYGGGAYEIRMYVGDHEPAHVHVYDGTGAAGVLLAKMRIDNEDVLDGYLPPPIRRDVRSVLGRNKDVLRDGWSRCRNGCHPLSIQ